MKRVVCIKLYLDFVAAVGLLTVATVNKDIKYAVVAFLFSAAITVALLTLKRFYK